MVELLNKLGDRMLSAIVPKKEASACNCRGGYYECKCQGGVAWRRWCNENCNCVKSCGGWYVGDCPYYPVC